MNNLINYILNAFLIFLSILMVAFFFTEKLYLVSVLIILCLVIYLIFSDVYFPSIGNIRKFVFTKKDVKKKLLVNLLYLLLYIVIIFMAGYFSPYFLVLVNLIVCLDIIFLIAKKKKFFSFLFYVDWSFLFHQNSLSTVFYKTLSFFCYVERFYNTLPAASMKAAGGYPILFPVHTGWLHTCRQSWRKYLLQYRRH